MSVQFGTLNFDRRPVVPELLEEAQFMIRPYGPDDCNSLIKDNLGIVYCALHTTKEARREQQPYVLGSGLVVTWDGRLDNRSELIAQLMDGQPPEMADVAIIAAAYERWGTECFAKLLGDWALTIWNPQDRTFILAKDFIGTRHLYYSCDNNEIRWSTILDPLVLLSGHRFHLNEEYLAGCFVGHPGSHMTPYIGIEAVPPCCYVLLTAAGKKISRYWDFDSTKQILYQTDAEYEEHFRAVFAEAVRRRLRSDSPILSDLSGGMDSSSIVCMADRLIEQGKATPPRLDTVSYYDNSEPNWNELPYLTKVEEQRGRTGYHIDVGSQEQVGDPLKEDHFSVLPGGSGRPTELAQKFFEYTRAQGYRVQLSGMGGDEALGGVPNPIPELADLLAGFELRRLMRRIKAWSLAQKTPWIHLLLETMETFVPAALGRAPEQVRKAPWLHPAFVRRNRKLFCKMDPTFSLFSSRPSFQSRMFTMEAMRKELETKHLSKHTCMEMRYPYLDRSLLEFLHAIPREQLLRPGQRRSLMRRALAGIVPREILERRRKAFVARGPIVGISNHWSTVDQVTQNMMLDSLGIIDQRAYREALDRARAGGEVALSLIRRPLGLELWVRALYSSNLLTPGASGNDLRFSGHPLSHQDTPLIIRS